MEIATIGNEYSFHIGSREHDRTHLLYIFASTLFFIIEVYQRISIEINYYSNDLPRGIHLPALNFYPTSLTPPARCISIAWYIVFVWQTVWTIYSFIGIFRRSNIGEFYYRHPCAMNKWCFFYTAFALILYTPQLSAAARHKYGIGISIFRHSVTFCEVIIVLSVVHVSLSENLRDYLRYQYFADVWLTRLLYHNGLALWASVLFFETCLSVIVGLDRSESVSSSNACLIGCSIYLLGILTFSIVENLIFSNALAFTLSPWFVFLWLLSGTVFSREIDDKTSIIVFWFIRFLFGLTCALALIRWILFFWRYKEKSIPTFQSPRIYSLITEPRHF